MLTFLEKKENITGMNKLIIVCGSPAVGKSTYAKGLALEGHAILVDIDTCTEPIIQIALAEAGKDPNDRDSPYFKEKFRHAIYETLFAIAKDNLNHSNVIIVGPFTKELREPDWPDQIAKTLGAIPEIHYLRCDPSIRKDRMSQRASARDQSKLEDWKSYLLYYGEEKPPVFEHILIDNS